MPRLDLAVCRNSATTNLCSDYTDQQPSYSIYLDLDLVLPSGWGSGSLVGQLTTGEEGTGVRLATPRSLDDRTPEKCDSLDATPNPDTWITANLGGLDTQACFYYSNFADDAGWGFAADIFIAGNAEVQVAGMFRPDPLDPDGRLLYRVDVQAEITVASEPIEGLLLVTNCADPECLQAGDFFIWFSGGFSIDSPIVSLSFEISGAYLERGGTTYFNFVADAAATTKWNLVNFVVLKASAALDIRAHVCLTNVTETLTVGDKTLRPCNDNQDSYAIAFGGRATLTGTINLLFTRKSATITGTACAQFTPSPGGGTNSNFGVSGTVLGYRARFGLSCDGLLPARMPQNIRTVASEWDSYPEITDNVGLDT